MVARGPALTDPSWLVPLLYRADWTQLCLSAEIGTRIERIRSVTISPGRGFPRPDIEYGDPDYPDDPDDPDDLDGEDEDPRETWRLASEEYAANAAGHDDEAKADGPRPGPRDRVSRLLIAPGGRYRFEDISLPTSSSCSPRPGWSATMTWT
jgi:hypothetical protein